MIEIFYWVASSPRLESKTLAKIKRLSTFSQRLKEKVLDEYFGRMKGHGMLLQLFVNSALNFVGCALDIPCHL